jgi:hypothetical protein
MQVVTDRYRAQARVVTAALERIRTGSPSPLALEVHSEPQVELTSEAEANPDLYQAHVAGQEPRSRVDRARRAKGDGQVGSEQSVIR